MLLNSLLKLPMFTLIGSLILIFKEHRFNRSEGLKVYQNFTELSRKIELFFLTGSIRKHNPLINSKNPGFLRNRGSCNGEPDDVLLSLEIQPTIIGDKVFHCPVRNGKEWDHLSMVIRQRLCCSRNSEFFTWSETKPSCDSLTQKFS